MRGLTVWAQVFGAFLIGFGIVKVFGFAEGSGGNGFAMIGIGAAMALVGNALKRS